MSSQGNILKSVQGSFNQGNERFGLTAGRQCTCNALSSVAFTLIKSQGTWNSRDMDFILENGDAIYKSLNINEHFAFKNSTTFTAIFQNYRVHPVYITNLHLSFLFQDIPIDTSGFLITLRSLTMSVTWTAKHYFLFDSHSRDNNGKICPDGFSVLLKFSSRKSLEQHILETYFLDVDEEYVCFAIQYIKVQLQNAPNFDAKLTYRLEVGEQRKKSETVKEKCRKRNQTEIQKENCRKRKRTETERAKCRERKQTEIDSVNKLKLKN